MKLIHLILLLFSTVAEGHYTYQLQRAGCTPVSLDESLENAETALLTYVKAEIHSYDSSFDYFKVTVQKVYQGCGCQRHDHIFIKSPRGLGVRTHTSVVLFGTLSHEHIMGYHHHQPVLVVDSCQANTPFYQLSWWDRCKLGWFQKRSCETPSIPTSDIYDASSQDFYGVNEETQHDPSIACYPSDCGPLPPDGNKATLCPDLETTVGSGTSKCVRNMSTSQCEWEVQTCPTCSSDAGCRRGEQMCDTDGFCAPAECSDDTECPRGDQFCEAGHCKTCFCDSGTPLSLCPDMETMGRGHGSDCLYVDGSCKREYVDCPKCDEDVVCGSDQVCIDEFCHPAQCSVSEECSADEICDYGRCIKCDCGAPRSEEFLCHDLLGLGNVAGGCFRAPNGQCVFEYSKCDACVSHSECQKLDKGICIEGQCESAQCLNDSHCAYDEVCEGYECITCDCGYPDREEFLCHDLIGLGNAASDCFRAPSGQCVFKYSECGACSRNDECHKLDNGVCANGRCESAQCLIDSHCAYKEVCDGYECVPCDCGYPDREEFLCHDLIGLGNVASDCFRSPSGKCVFEYSECSSCSRNDECHKLDKGICVDGQCESAECLSESHCAYNEVCEDYECIPCDCGYPDRQEFICHDLIGSGNVPGECYRAVNGQCILEYSKCASCSSNDECHKLDKGICVGGQCESAQCMSDNHCAYNEVCEDYECIPCDCGYPDREEYVCHDLIGFGNIAGECFRGAPPHGYCLREYSACAPCTANADCHKLDKGICVNGQCESAQCLQNSHCSTTEVCQDHQCIPCDCGRPDRAEFLCHDHSKRGNVPGTCYRSDNNGQCVYEYSTCDKCNSDGDCYRLDKGICVDGECESAQCLSHSHCSVTEVCQDHQCVPCDCGRPDRAEFLCHDHSKRGNVPGTCYRSDGDGRCVFEYSTCDKCNSDGDCYRLDKGICMDGECESAECLDDSHCGHDEVCLEHQCTKCDCGRIDKEEYECHDNLNFGNVPGPCLRENNGSCVQEYSTCDPCQHDGDCSQVYNGVCRGGTCESAECLLDNQCNDSQRCGAGFCVACDCGNPSRGETRCFDGTLAGPDKCIRDQGTCFWTYIECPICDVDFFCPYGFNCEYGECVEAVLSCQSAYDCPNFAEYCLSGYCSKEGCRYDKDCFSDEVCSRNGHCEKKQESFYRL